MKREAQGSLEYILLIGGAIVFAAAVILILINITGEEEDILRDGAIQGFKDIIPEEIILSDEEIDFAGLEIGDIINFFLQDPDTWEMVAHTGTIIDFIDDDKILVLLASTPQEVILTIGETTVVEFDEGFVAITLDYVSFEESKWSADLSLGLANAMDCETLFINLSGWQQAGLCPTIHLPHDFAAFNKYTGEFKECAITDESPGPDEMVCAVANSDKWYCNTLKSEQEKKFSDCAFAKQDYACFNGLTGDYRQCSSDPSVPADAVCCETGYEIDYCTGLIDEEKNNPLSQLWRNKYATIIEATGTAFYYEDTLPDPIPEGQIACTIPQQIPHCNALKELHNGWFESCLFAKQDYACFDMTTGDYRQCSSDPSVPADAICCETGYEINQCTDLIDNAKGNPLSMVWTSKYATIIEATGVTFYYEDTLPDPIPEEQIACTIPQEIPHCNALKLLHEDMFDSCAFAGQPYTCFDMATGNYENCYFQKYYNDERICCDTEME